MVVAVVFFAKEGMDECMLVCGMEALSRSENVKFVGCIGICMEEGFKVEVRDAVFSLRDCQSAELFCCCCISVDFILSSRHF
jgi:hypothetical protein